MLVIFDGVVGKIQKQLPQPVPVSHHREIFATIQADLNLAGSREALRIREGFVEEFIQSHRLAFKRDLSGVRPCQKCQAVNDLAQPLHFVQFTFEPLPL